MTFVISETDCGHYKNVFRRGIIMTVKIIREEILWKIQLLR
jgi:hypothetical protein